MDRIECPSCRTAYTFARAGVTAPNDPNTKLSYTTICSACSAEFVSVVQWQSVKTKHRDNWLMRTILRRAPETEYVFRVVAVSKLV